MTNQKYKVSVVSYTNTLPFKVALENSNAIKNYAVLSYDNPAVCAQKLINNESDIGLIPVGAFPKLSNYHIISDYCIGADGSVETVMLYGNVPIQKMKSVYLDPQSRTSVNLTRVLAANYWRVNPEFINGDQQYDINQLANDDGFVLIGDRTFVMKNQFKYEYDLAEEWKKYTGLPFVFAAWVSNKPVERSFIDVFNSVLKEGIDQIPQISEEYKHTIPNTVDLFFYLNQCISYPLDGKKKEAMKKFLLLMNDLQL
jgi:chorismate dehydratase